MSSKKPAYPVDPKTLYFLPKEAVEVGKTYAMYKLRLLLAP